MATRNTVPGRNASFFLVDLTIVPKAVRISDDRGSRYIGCTFKKTRSWNVDLPHAAGEAAPSVAPVTHLEQLVLAALVSVPADS